MGAPTVGTQCLVSCRFEPFLACPFRIMLRGRFVEDDMDALKDVEENLKMDKQGGPQDIAS